MTGFILGVLAGVYLLDGYALEKHDDSVTQVSTIDALLNGLYDGVLPYGELKRSGTFGIGTFEALDGEMVALDGNFYHVKADGAVYKLENAGMNYTQFQDYLDGTMRAKNIFHAVKLEGAFYSVKTRSVPRQEKPYPPLVEVTANQTIFEFNEVRGTIIGFYCPDYLDGLKVPGYHLHFITEDRTAGGHVLEFRVKDAQLSVDYSSQIRIILPDTDEFNRLDLTESKKEEIEEAEK
ncbi:MAG: acetolactate decarboxylase [Methanophagales archaeon ANME-1-THS]|nr:MAG: acetolactate decarboxylase [Methanophagales archaeon ANME-1-THS]